MRGKCEFAPAEARLRDLLRPKLLADGLYFVTVDSSATSPAAEVFTPGGFHSARGSTASTSATTMTADLQRRVRLRAAYRTTFDPEAADVV